MPSDATRLKRALERWALLVVDEATDYMVEYARQDAPRVTGELANSIRAKNVHQRGTRMAGGLEATVIQAATTSKGARPHVIRPKRVGGVLVFYWPKAGRTVAFSHVNHPGNRGTQWWPAMIRRRWPRALRRAARGRRL